MNEKKLVEHEVSKLKMRSYLDIVLVVAPMIIAHFIPAPAPLTPLGVQILGIFIGLIYGWIACGMIWPSLVGIVMLGFTTYGGSPQASLASALTNSSALTMIVCFVLFSFISASGITDVVAKWLVTRKFTIGKPWAFAATLMLAGAFLGGVLNTIVLIIVCFEFLSPLLKKMGYTKEDMFPTYLFLGIAINIATPSVWPSFLPKSIYTRGVISSSLGVDFTTFQYFVLITVPLFIMVFMYLVLGKFILRIDTSKFAAGSELLLQQMGGSDSFRLSEKEKQGAIILSLFAVSMLLMAILPADWPFISLLNKLGVVGVSVLLTVAVVVLRAKDGTTWTDFNTMMRSLDWNVYMLTATIMTISGAVTSADAGILAMLNKLVLPLLSQMSLVAFVITVMLIMCVACQLCNNMVLQMVFAPLLAQMLLSAGYNPSIAVLAVYLGSQMAMLAPSGSIIAAMVFGRTEWVNSGTLYKIAIPWIAITMVVWIIWTLIMPNIVYPM